MNRKISNLSAILALIQETELMRLSSLSDEKNTILSEIKVLTKLKLTNKAVEQTSETIQPWQFLGGEQKWLHWLNVRIAEKNSDLAILAANFEEQKVKTQCAVGRRDAFIRFRQIDGKSYKY